MPSAASSRSASSSAKLARVRAGLLRQLQRHVGGVVAVPLLPRSLDRHRRSGRRRAASRRRRPRGPCSASTMVAESCVGSHRAKPIGGSRFPSRRFRPVVSDSRARNASAHASVAQGIEHWFPVPGVAGSNPAGHPSPPSPAVIPSRASSPSRRAWPGQGTPRWRRRRCRSPPCTHAGGDPGRLDLGHRLGEPEQLGRADGRCAGAASTASTPRSMKPRPVGPAPAPCAWMPRSTRCWLADRSKSPPEQVVADPGERHRVVRPEVDPARREALGLEVGRRRSARVVHVDAADAPHQRDGRTRTG